jgi:putative ABC transport system permease protein
MSETFFPVNDLLRRRLQTSLIIISLTLCVAATVSLLLLAENIGLAISLTVGGEMTTGISTVFSQFIAFIGLLIFLVGASIISFMTFIMTSQRVRDIGLMKAAGCPNDLVFGYFMIELLIVTVVGCVLGVVLGLVANSVSISLLNYSGFQISQKPINLWLVLLTFIVFFILAQVFGVKPILDVTKVKPVKAISPTYHLGVSKESGFKAVSNSGLTAKIALRSLFRRKSSTVRIVICFVAFFILVTVAVAGSVIANQTTKSWVEKAIGKDVILIGHQDMCNQYKVMLSGFYETIEDSQFNYTNKEYSMSDAVLDRITALPGVISFDTRLVLYTSAEEVPGYVFDPETVTTFMVGDDRSGESLVVGVEPKKVLNEWFLEGEFLHENQTAEAVVGDSLARKMFSKPLNQGIRLLNRSFDVTGVCVDPLNKGNVTYVPLRTLQKITGTYECNIVLARMNSSADDEATLNRIRTEVRGISRELEVYKLNEALDRNLDFLNNIWSIITFLSSFSLIAASLCSASHVMLMVTEQHQEFGVLRAIGAKPRTIMKIILEQNLIVLLSGYVPGIAIGLMITLLILIPEPVISFCTVVYVAGLLLLSLFVILIFSFYPAVKFARKPILTIMHNP